MLVNQQSIHWCGLVNDIGAPAFIPVLVGGAQLPSKKDLPQELATLCDWDAREISDTRWDYDARRLMKELRAAIDESGRLP